MSTAIKHLLEEHRAAERMMKALTESLSPFNPDRLRRALHFFKFVVDRVHHAKEEDALFPVLLARTDEVEQETLAKLQKQHSHGRSFLKAAEALLTDAEKGSESAQEALAQTISSFEKFNSVHMRQEEKVLFPLAAQLLDEVADAEVLERFELVQQLLISEKDYELYMAFSRETVGAHTMVVTPPLMESETVIANIGRVLYDDGKHRTYLLGPAAGGLSVQANHYMIVDGEQGMLLDPGGPKVYRQLFKEAESQLGNAKLEYIFLSHQDPDVGTSLNGWLMDTDAEALVSKLWIRFLPHYGLDSLLSDRLRPIEDEGTILTLGNADVAILPAHFMHSPGNLHVFDPLSKTLFSGDLGASTQAVYAVVEDFETHAQNMLGFHQRYMANRDVVRAWVRMVRQLDVQNIAPQHGAMLMGEDMVARFLDWCEEVPCGTDLFTERFGLPTQRFR